MILNRNSYSTPCRQVGTKNELIVFIKKKKNRKIYNTTTYFYTTYTLSKQLYEIYEFIIIFYSFIKIKLFSELLVQVPGYIKIIYCKKGNIMQSAYIYNLYLNSVSKRLSEDNYPNIQISCSRDIMSVLKVNWTDLK